MNFFDWLEKMRNKPIKSQRLIAFAVALSFTGLLFVTWLSVLLPGFFHSRDVAQKNEEKNDTFDTPKDTFVENITSAWHTLGEQFGALKTTVSDVNLSAAVQYSATSTASTTTLDAASTTTSTTSTTASSTPQ